MHCDLWHRIYLLLYTTNALKIYLKTKIFLQLVGSQVSYLKIKILTTNRPKYLNLRYYMTYKICFPHVPILLPMVLLEALFT